MELKHLFSEHEKTRLTLSIFYIMMVTEPERVKVEKARLLGTQVAPWLFKESTLFPYSRRKLCVYFNLNPLISEDFGK